MFKFQTWTASANERGQEISIPSGCKADEITATDSLGNSCAQSPTTIDGSTVIDINPDEFNNPQCQINIEENTFVETSECLELSIYW